MREKCERKYTESLRAISNILTYIMWVSVEEEKGTQKNETILKAIKGNYSICIDGEWYN